MYNEKRGRIVSIKPLKDALCLIFTCKSDASSFAIFVPKLFLYQVSWNKTLLVLYGKLVSARDTSSKHND